MRFVLNTAGLYRPDMKAFTKALHTRMKRLWTGATQEFLRAIVEADVIQVDTGMSKASLLPLSRAVRMLTTVRASINPKTAERKGYKDLPGFSSGDVKSMEMGELLGQQAYVLDFGSIYKLNLKFRFEIAVYQYHLHENGLVRGSGPWNSLIIGQNAFIDYIDKNAAKAVPDLREWWFKPTMR